jgi:hypothetical protein
MAIQDELHCTQVDPNNPPGCDTGHLEVQHVDLFWSTWATFYTFGMIGETTVAQEVALNKPSIVEHRILEGPTAPEVPWAPWGVMGYSLVPAEWFDMDVIVVRLDLMGYSDFLGVTYGRPVKLWWFYRPTDHTRDDLIRTDLRLWGVVGWIGKVGSDADVPADEARNHLFGPRPTNPAPPCACLDPDNPGPDPECESLQQSCETCACPPQLGPQPMDLAQILEDCESWYGADSEFAVFEGCRLERTLLALVPYAGASTICPADFALVNNEVPGSPLSGQDAIVSSFRRATAQIPDDDSAPWHWRTLTLNCRPNACGTDPGADCSNSLSTQFPAGSWNNRAASLAPTLVFSK